MVSHIPVWVFGVLAALLYFGVRQSRPRLVAPRTLATVALAMLGLSLHGVIAAFGVQPAPLLAWALGIAISASFGGPVFAPRGLSKVSSSSVRMPGSWLPLVLMMAIFAAKFFLGMATALHLPVVEDPAFVSTASLVFGLLSGAFAARARAVWGFVRNGPAAS